MNVYVPGSYNQWQALDPSVKADREDKKRYVFHRVLPRGIHRFKFVIEGDWKNNWGARGQTRLIAPSSGDLIKEGDDIVVNAPDAGSFTFSLDLAHHRWQIETAPHAGGFAEALNGSAQSSRLQTLLRALAACNGAGLPDAALDEVEELLHEQSRNGGLPLRTDGRALLAYLAQPEETVQVAASWRGWGDGLIPLSHIPYSLLHAAIVPVPSGTHEYKVVYNGQWSRDRYNPWVTPDRVPVPKFQLGEFNSVLAVDESPIVSGRNLLWYPDFRSVTMGNARDIFVWLPPGYTADKARRYRTLYVLDGNESLTRNFVHETVLELMAAGQMEDVILVFVAFADNHQRLWEFSDEVGRQKYAAFFVNELVPYIDTQFRTDAKATGRGIYGVSLGGNFSYYLAWTCPQTFGAAGAQGASWQWQQWDIIRLYQSEPARPVRLYLDSAYPTWDGDAEDNSAASRHAAGMLQDLGYSVTHFEMPSQPHDWESWRLRQPHLLRWFAPLVVQSPRRRSSVPAP